MIAAVFLIMLSAYVLCGFVFAIPFVLKGAGKIDPHAAHGSWGFRILIVPRNNFFVAASGAALDERSSIPARRKKCAPLRCAKGSPPMIRQLRQRHRIMMLGLSVILPVALVSGVALRKTVPISKTLPYSIAGEKLQFDSLIWTRDDLWKKNPIRTRLVAENSGQIAVELIAAENILRPDLIIYWIPVGAKIDD